MTIMKRLLLPFLLLGLALLPSGISAANQGAAASDAEVSLPTHGKPHPHKHPHHDEDTEAEAEQEARDNDEQESEQTNVVDGQSLLGDVIPVAANIPVIPINNLQANVIGLVNINTVNAVLDVLPVNLELIPINLCAVIPVVTGEEVDESGCELEADEVDRHNEQEQSQLRNQEAHSGNDTYNQSNEAEQEQEGEQEQEQGQINVGDSAPARTGSSPNLVTTG